MKPFRLVSWVRHKMRESVSDPSQVDKIVNPALGGSFDMKRWREVLIHVALLCVEEDKDMRPRMGEVVEMLLQDESNDLQWQ